MALRAGLDRIERELGLPGLAATLAEDPPGSDLTTVLLEVMARRAAARSPGEVLAHHERDRFTLPVRTDGRGRAQAALTALLALPSDVEVVELSPVAPLGTHSVVATVHQDKVVATVRGTEVAADPTNGLALECAARRRRTRHDPVARGEAARLAALQRVLRGQPFEDPRHQQHFWLLGLVTACRDSGVGDVEVDAAASDVLAMVAAARAAGALRVRVAVTDIDDPQGAPLLTRLAGTAASTGSFEVVAAPERTSGRGYYRRGCWKLHVAGADGAWTEVGDGGLTDWTARLCSDERERLHIAGLAPGTLHTALHAAPA